MSFPGFSMGPMGSYRFGGDQGGDFNLFTALGSPSGPAHRPNGRFDVVLEEDFRAYGDTVGDFASEDPDDSSTWQGAWRTGAFDAGTIVYLRIMPGAEIRGRGGNGGDGGHNALITYGSGGGGNGHRPPPAGTVFAPATAGTAGTLEGYGLAGTPSGPGPGGVTPSTAGEDGQHALIIDNGVTLYLENYGKIIGGGAGGHGGTYPPFTSDFFGWAGLPADQDLAYIGPGHPNGGVPGRNGAAGASIMMNDLGAGATPGTGIVLVTPFAYPYHFGFLYRDGLRNQGAAVPNLVAED